MQSTDEYIMRQVQEGDLSKASVLYDRYQLPIYNYFINRNHKSVAAEDMLQIVFERMIRYRSSYDTTASFRTWIYSIARNVGYDELKKSQKQSTYTLEENHMNLISKASSTFESQDLIMKGFERLQEDDRELLKLAKLDGMKYKDIAKLLGITEAHVKVKVYRSVKQLKDILLNQLGYEYE